MRRPRIEIVKGDIAAEDTEAVVNAANSHLWMGSGVAGAIKKTGGVEIEREAVSKGPISVGDAVWTRSGRLGAKYVIHAAVMGQDLQTSRTKIRNATISSLRVAGALGVKSISFPALGTGVGGFPLEEAAETMLLAILDTENRDPSSLELIRLVLFGDEAFRAFRLVRDRLMADSGL